MFCSRACCYKTSLVALMFLIKGSIIIPHRQPPYKLLLGALRNSLLSEVSKIFGVLKKKKRQKSVKTRHTCSPDKLISGMSPPPFGVRLVILSLKTSASVVLVTGPKSAFQRKFHKPTILTTTV